MQHLENNKILAAILVAGIVASFSGFIAKKLVVSHDVKAAGAEAAGDAGGEVAAAPEMPGPILGLIAAASATHGGQIAKACGACHNFDKGGPNGVGPNLWNVLTRGHAGSAGFSYSDDMEKVKGHPWTYEDLNKFIWKPRSLFPGTKMTFVGLKKDQDRADVIAFLRTLADSPAPAPTDAEIAQEKKDLAPAASADQKAGVSPPNSGAATPPVAQKGAAATPVTKAKTPEQGKAESQSGTSDTTPATTPPSPQQ